MSVKKWIPWNWFKNEEKGKNYYRMERSYGSFQRMLSLPEDADQNEVTATFKKTDEVDLQINGKNLTISGERKIQFEGENAKYHRREREADKFSRVIGLPGDIDSNSVEAKMVNGILTVVISKSETSKPKQISVD